MIDSPLAYFVFGAGIVFFLQSLLYTIHDQDILPFMNRRTLLGAQAPVTIFSISVFMVVIALYGDSNIYPAAFVSISFAVTAIIIRILFDSYLRKKSAKYNIDDVLITDVRGGMYDNGLAIISNIASFLLILATGTVMSDSYAWYMLYIFSIFVGFGMILKECYYLLEHTVLYQMNINKNKINNEMKKVIFLRLAFGSVVKSSFIIIGSFVCLVDLTSRALDESSKYAFCELCDPKVLSHWEQTYFVVASMAGADGAYTPLTFWARTISSVAAMTGLYIVSVALVGALSVLSGDQSDSGLR